MQLTTAEKRVYCLVALVLVGFGIVVWRGYLYFALFWFGWVVPAAALLFLAAAVCRGWRAGLEAEAELG